MVKTSSSSLEAVDSIAGWAAKIATCLVAKKPKHNQQKQHCKKSNKCFKNGPNKKYFKKIRKKRERETGCKEKVSPGEKGLFCSTTRRNRQLPPLWKSHNPKGTPKS